MALIGNGLNKGDDPERVKTIEASPRLKGLWRLPAGRGKESMDGDPNMIANDQPRSCPGHTGESEGRTPVDGEIAVTNERNGFSKTYKPGK